MENEGHEYELSHAARVVAQRARQMALAAGITLISLEWHRGHEVADLDNFWLTLESNTDSVTEKFPNEWLKALGSHDNDQRISVRLAGMLRALLSRPEAHVTKAPLH